MTLLSNDFAHAQAALADSQIALRLARDECTHLRKHMTALQRQRHAFLASLAHDLRNPLAPLSNGIELLRLTDHDAASRLRTRGIMERQLRQLMGIADKLSYLARLTDEPVTLAQSSFALSIMLRSLCEEVRPLLAAQELKLDIAENVFELLEGLQLHGDAQRLSQGLGYLVNALIRHCERQGGILIKAILLGGSVHLQLLPQLSSGDNFTVSREATAEDLETATLGLDVAVCEQLLTLHGGSLRVQRHLETRAVCFTVTLPVLVSTAEGGAVAMSRKIGAAV